MAQVFPFRAFRYNPTLVRFEGVLTQPYDKITPAMQDRYYAGDPHNLITVEKGRSHSSDTTQNNVYTRAAAALSDWIRGGILRQDPAPAFYAYSQEYTVPGTQERRIRRGFIGAGRLEEYSAGVVFRHEQTLSGPKVDRLELLRHTQTHTGQLFMLYADPRRRVDEILAEAESSTPDTELCDEYGVLHRLWIVSRPRDISEIQRAMAERKLVIADGHHRYETALAYRDECRASARKSDRDAPFERVMMTFILMMIIVVAAFSISNTLITVIVQKKREIGVIKALGAAARAKIEALLGQRVFLDLHVKVLPKWRRDEPSLKRLGYATS